mmetsp:Transcript_8691/g.16134  ORF Transcript_8691/g.16134 Transcript_8691/m.16134 type:complete len:276 (-) Transcript_8691:2672-3499(-)
MVSWKVLPRLQAVTQLGVVPCAQTKILHQGLHQLGRVHPPTRVCSEGTCNGFRRGSDLGLKRCVEVQAVSRLPTVVLGAVESTRVMQDRAGIDCTLNECSGGLWVARVHSSLAEHVAQFRFQVIVLVDHGIAGRCCSLKIGTTVHAFQDTQVVPKVADQTLALVRKVFWLADDRPIETFEPLPRDSSITEHSPVHIAISTILQKANVCLAYGHVIGGGVIVKLLVPLFHPSALHLLDLVPMHNMQDIVSDLLAIGSTLPDTTHAHAGPLLRGATI